MDKITILPNEKNPRKINPSDDVKLSETLKEFGDLGGIVVNVRDDKYVLVSGHQRSRKLDINNLKIEDYVVEKTDNGTVGYGYVVFNGERFQIRFVDWDKNKEERAMIVANKVGGFFDYEALSNFDIELLLQSGFTQPELDRVFHGPDIFEDFDEDFDEEIGTRGGIYYKIVFPDEETAQKILNDLDEITSRYDSIKVNKNF